MAKEFHPDFLNLPDGNNLPRKVIPDGKELSTNNCCKFMAIFIVFPGFCLKQLQQLFSDNS